MRSGHGESKRFSLERFTVADRQLEFLDLEAVAGLLSQRGRYLGHRTEIDGATAIGQSALIGAPTILRSLFPWRSERTALCQSAGIPGATSGARVVPTPSGNGEPFACRIGRGRVSRVQQVIERHVRLTEHGRESDECPSKG